MQKNIHHEMLYKYTFCTAGLSMDLMTASCLSMSPPTCNRDPSSQRYISTDPPAWYTSKVHLYTITVLPIKDTPVQILKLDTGDRP